MSLQAKFTRLKKESNDTIITVGYDEFTSLNSFAAWWKTNYTVPAVNGHTSQEAIHLCFPDAPGIMAMASGTQDVVTTDLEEMTFQFKAKKIGYAT